MAEIMLMVEIKKLKWLDIKIYYVKKWVKQKKERK